MYQVVENSSLTALKTRYSKLPTVHNRVVCEPAFILGRYHKVFSFAIKQDGSISINYNNEDTYDTYSISINMARVDYNVDLLRLHNAFKSWMGETVANNWSGKNTQMFSISVGDIFKHYYKQNLALFEVKEKKKGTRKNKKAVEEEDAVDENGYVLSLVQKTLKVMVGPPNVRAILGSTYNWKDPHLRLWDELTQAGYLTPMGTDLVSFCNMQIVLPLHDSTAGEAGADQFVANLTSFVTHGFIKQLARYFLYNEDPATRQAEQAERVWFDEPKTIREILELYAKDYKGYNKFEKTYRKLRAEPNTAEIHLLKERYTPVLFSEMSVVEPIYPLFAFRNIYLESWQPPIKDTYGYRSSPDMETLVELVTHATNLAKSDPVKHVVQKRGKYQHYNKYSQSGGAPWRESDKGEIKQAGLFYRAVTTDLYDK